MSVDQTKRRVLFWFLDLGHFEIVCLWFSRRLYYGRVFRHFATQLGMDELRGGTDRFVSLDWEWNPSPFRGKFDGKRSRGRQREKIMDGLVTWLETGKVLDTLAAVKDRDLWRDMIANAYKQGT
ncbi:hypothetical protein PoB_002293100 [Plakobranchus ocellatus]|uniref:Uncharacterized protein n=1 Tax=Plakobranchus ocellatus TaxID=259542 RepID=A0AAV3ZAX9_9GAST|nr:hypothetical protein PoB_002293100 [Plakobranchus ocellatus]